jgi:hypothetical protein
MPNAEEVHDLIQGKFQVGGRSHAQVVLRGG